MSRPDHTSSLIEPINQQQMQQVVESTHDYLQRAAELFARSFAQIPVHFDLRGRAAGMYTVRSGVAKIRYNPHIFAKYFSSSLHTTVPHEVAHYVTDQLYGLHNIRPHGREWQQVMRAFGVRPQATGNYDLTGVPVRRQRRFSYQCACREHQLSCVRHNKIQRRQMRYLCQLCGTLIRFSGDEP
jgi:SprT protein